VLLAGLPASVAHRYRPIQEDDMESENDRAHGVTPHLSQDYATRRAERQAAYFLTYLRPGMNVLDVGCGPGTITLGVAQAVAPGRVTGIDHDDRHIKDAEMLAAERGVQNVSFAQADVLSLPLSDETFEAAFENNLFVHLADRAADAAREVYRVLVPGGCFAARDVDTDAVMWGGPAEGLNELDRFMTRWQQSRGSDLTMGRKLSSILRQAGFRDTRKSVSADTKGDPEAVSSHADITLSLLDGPLGQAIVDNGWGDSSEVERLKTQIRRWSEHPDAFFANVHVEVIGWKPAQSKD